MSDNQLFLDYLRKKNSLDPLESKNDEKCNEFTNLFTNDDSTAGEIDNNDDLEMKMVDPIKLGTIMELENQLNKINCKFPFFHFKSFLEDYINGEYKSEIVEKYQLTSVKDIKEITTILQLPKRKEKLKKSDISDFARKNNMKKDHDVYFEYIENYNLFKNKIDTIYFSNILKSKIILEIIKGKDRIEKLNQNKIINIKEFKFLNKIFYNTKSANSRELTFNELESFFESNHEQMLKKILDYNIVHNEDGELSVRNNSSMSQIEDEVISKITSEEKGLSFKQISNLVLEQFIHFIHLPYFTILKNILVNFESESKVKIQEESNKKNGFSERHFFSSTYYEKQVKFSKKAEKNQYLRKMFFGRQNVSGIEFVYELERLELGMLDDVDDQVTRIAGLILATNQKIMTSAKSNELFEISTDVIQYNPTPEEEELMKNMDFVMKPETDVMHLKIMLGEKITKNLIETMTNFYNSPEGINSQIVIVSFENNDDVLNDLPSDHSIQIVNKKQVVEWIDIVPIIPCRRGTVVKVMSGIEIRTIGKILHMYYDTGTAVLEQVGTGKEITCMIGELEEFDLNDQSEEDYSLLHNNFFDFLNSLIKLSNHNLVVETVFDYKVNEDETVEGEHSLYYTTRRDDFTVSEPLRVNITEVNDRTTVRSTVNIDPSKQIFQCTCNNFSSAVNNVENNSRPLAMCNHTIIILIDVGISNNLFLHEWQTDTNPINYILNGFNTETDK